MSMIIGCQHCSNCGNAFDDTSGRRSSTSIATATTTAEKKQGETEGPFRTPIASRACGHVICLECALNVHLLEEAKSEQGSPTSLPWMDCPLCRAPFSFNADTLSGEHAAAAAHHTLHSQRPPPPPAEHHTSHHQHAAPPHHYNTPPPPPPPSTPYGYGSSYPHHPGVYVSPASHSPYHHHRPHPGPYAYPSSSWQHRDYSPLPVRGEPTLTANNSWSTHSDFHPPARSGYDPSDCREATHSGNMSDSSTSSPRRYPSSEPSTPSSLPRKRLRAPMRSKTPMPQATFGATTTPTRPEASPPAASASLLPHGGLPSLSASSSKEKHWLVCRICSRPVQVTCQRLLSGPPPDHESLWPQVRLGKRLAAALRQHNQQFHPDWFMWNVKGRAAMATCFPTDVDDETAVAQTALLKALEAAFEHLPHVSGEDEYESKSVFVSRSLRRIGFAYAYISYTSSEWTKWQQWKKDSYSRVQIQAKARQLLEVYEANLHEAIDKQWEQISAFSHQDKIDLYQNIFVLPQTIFECLHYGRLPMQYGDITDITADSSC